MNTITASATNIHSLGYRDNMRLTQSSKQALFKDALNAMSALIAGDGSEHLSMPALAKLIFSTRSGNPQLDIIREAMKRNSFLSMHDLSASGYKLLAYMAIVHDSKCLNGNEIDLDRTKSVIRSFFPGSTRIDFDDSAIRNIRIENDVMVFGRNRIGKLDDAPYSATIGGIEAYRACSARSSIHIVEHHFNLADLGVNSTIADVKSSVIGDAHGRIDFIIGWLVSVGAVKVQDSVAMKRFIEEVRGPGSNPANWPALIDQAKCVE